MEVITEMPPKPPRNGKYKKFFDASKNLGEGQYLKIDYSELPNHKSFRNAFMYFESKETETYKICTRGTSFIISKPNPHA